MVDEQVTVKQKRKVNPYIKGIISGIVIMLAILLIITVIFNEYKRVYQIGYDKGWTDVVDSITKTKEIPLFANYKIDVPNETDKNGTVISNKTVIQKALVFTNFTEISDTAVKNFITNLQKEGYVITKKN